MPTYTSRLGLPLPLGTEFHNLENYKALINKIDQTAAAKTDVDNHVANKSNPHATTAAQVGAYTKAEADTKLSTGLATKTNTRGYSNQYLTGITGVDLNTFYESGTFVGGNLVNAPDDSSATFIIQNMVHTNNWIVQSAYLATTPNNTYYTRKSVSGTWTNWEIQALTSSNVASATKLQTARTIAGVAFDGTSNISIPAGNVGAYTKAEVDSRIATTVGGNVASATKLQTARTINGVAFDGTADIEVLAQQKTDAIPANADLDTYKTVGNYSCAANADAATLKNCPTVNAFNLQVMSNKNTSSGTILTQILHEYMPYAGAKTYIRRGYTSQWSNWYAIGVADGSLQSGLYAQTASRLATARAITLTGGVTGSSTFDGTATASIATTIVGNAPTATTATKLATARAITLTGGVTGSTTFDGSGNVSIAATVAGNAPTATKLATARTINGTAFDGTSDITITADPNQKDIPANTNLDNLTTPGFWNSVTDGNASTMTNAPFGTGTFTLQVETAFNNARIIQTAKRASDGDVAIRYKTESMSSFSAWTGFAKSNNIQQAGLIAEKAGSLQSSRTIALSGAVTGSVVFDGSSNATIATSPGSTVVNTTAAQSIDGTKEFTSVPTSGGVPLAQMTNVALPMKGLLSGAIDWDSLTEIGLYYANGITNKPNLCSNYGHLEVICQINTANVIQRYTDANGTTIQRCKQSSEWMPWKLVAYDSGWQSLAYASPFVPFNTRESNKGMIRRVGNSVHLRGIISVSKDTQSTDQETLFMFSSPLPTWARPDYDTRQLQQGSTKRTWLLAVNATGNVNCARYGDYANGKYDVIGIGHWLPYDIVYNVSYNAGI